MINAHDRQVIQAWDKNQNTQQTLWLRADRQGERNDFTRFCREFCSLASSVRIETREDRFPKGHDLPGLVLKDNILYSAIPLERELPPFLEGLSLIRSGKPAPFKDISNALDRIPAPCDLTLYIFRQCPHCPGVVTALLPLAVFSKKVHLTIVDGSLFPEMVQENRILSAPCLVMDNEFRWTGAVPVPELIDMMIRRDPSKISADSLRKIIEEGNAQWIADKMVEADAIFPSFMELLIHDTWSVRLGAMVVMESLGQNHPGLAEKVCPLLMDAFFEKEIPVQGDILYALGQAGGPDTRDWLVRTMTGIDHPDLIEAGKDALADLESRFQTGHCLRTNDE